MANSTTRTPATRIPTSRLTAQGQVSIPVAVRRKLGLGPGSVVEWRETDGGYTVRRSARRSSADIHAALFPSAPTPTSLDQLKTGLTTHAHRKHARD
jgi:AbrB family looped-hinge helix DNA binding protein